MIVAFTGHRPDKLNKEYTYEGPCSEFLKNKLKKVLIERQVSKAITGMALGFDTLAALVCLELDIPLLAAIPFAGQEKFWPKTSQDLYWKILNNSLVERHIVSDGCYAAYKMQKRNIFMVDECQKLIAAHDGSAGGTLNTIRYAQKIDRDIIYINPNEWKNNTSIQNVLFE